MQTVLPPDPSVSTAKPFASPPGSSPGRTRWVLNLILPPLLPLAGAIPELTGWGRSIAAVSNAHTTPVTPAGYAFVIWLPIFALAIAWGVWQALPSARATPLAQRLGWPLAICFALNILWMLLIEFTGMGWHLVVVILAALAFALAAFLLFVRDPGESGVGRTIAAPLVGLLAGWVSMASFANVGAAAHATALMAEGAAGSFTAVLLLLAAGGFATAVVALVRDALWYLLGAGWALVAILLANTGVREVDLAPAIAAGAMLALVVGVHIMRRRHA